jgi:hypothetical protein
MTRTLEDLIEERRRNMRELYERLNGEPPDDNPKGIPMTSDFDTGPARQALDYLSTLDDAEVAKFVKAARDQVGTRELVRNLFAPGADDGGLAGLVPRGGKEDK